MDGCAPARMDGCFVRVVNLSAGLASFSHSRFALIDAKNAKEIRPLRSLRLCVRSKS